MRQAAAPLRSVAQVGCDPPTSFPRQGAARAAAHFPPPLGNKVCWYQVLGSVTSLPWEFVMCVLDLPPAASLVDAGVAMTWRREQRAVLGGVWLVSHTCGPDVSPPR